MYQQIRLRRLSNESTATSSKVVEFVELKQNKNDNIFINDDVLALKELSNKMDELEEVILVEDEPALTLPQLSNECWDNFVEELSNKCENDVISNSGYTTAFQNATSVFQAKRRLENFNTISAPNTERVAATNDKSILSISSDEGDRNSSDKIKDQNATTCAILEPGELPKSTLNDNNGETDEIKADNSHLNEQYSIRETDEDNKKVSHGNGNSRSNTEQEDGGDSRNKDMSELNNTRNTSCLNRHKGSTGITKKYQDIKRKSYQVTFHQILRSFEMDKSASTKLSTVPGFAIELDFPDFDMKEFVKFVKNFQMTENIDDVRHLWTQVKTWLTAMKPPYDSTTNYTKYHRKLNWYLTELMSQYIKFEIEHSVQNENYYKLKLESLLNTVSSLLNDDVKLKILTLLRTDFPSKPSNLLDDLFKKYLTHPQLRLENNIYGNYRLKVLAYQKWMHYTNRKKQDIIEIAIKEGSAYLPRLVPKNIEDPFYSVDNSVHHIDDFDKQGTRKLLEEVVSIDMLQATINKYLQVYENQLYDSYDFSLLRPYNLEKGQTLCVQNTTSRAAPTHIQTHNSPNQPVSARHDVRHCHRRRMHHCHNQHQHHHHHCEQYDTTNCSTGRSTHLSAGCDIHRRNRLSSSPLRSYRCNSKLLASKNQSDTSLSHTYSTNDIISLDSTDDEGDNDKVSVEKSKTINEKVNQTKTQRMVRTKNRHCAGNRYTQNSKPSNIAHKRKKQIGVKPKKLDTIVLDSSSDEETEKSTNATVTTNDSVNLADKPTEKPDHADNIPAQEPAANNQQQQQQQQQPTTPTQQAACARPQSQSVAMPLRCALIGSVAIKPIRKEKHCIPGEVSSTTSHDDIVETQRLSQTSAISSNAQPMVSHTTSGYENAREVGTVEILESSNVVAVNAVGDEDADEHDEEVSNSAIFPMWGYSKVVEEATSSTEIFQRIQSFENVTVSAALRLVESAPVVAPVAGSVFNVVPVNEEAPTCSRYVNNNARRGSETDADNQSVMPLLAIEWSKSLENISNEIADVGMKKFSKSCIDLANESNTVGHTTAATSDQRQSVVSIDAAREEELPSEHNKQQLELSTPIQIDFAVEQEKDEKATTIKTVPSFEVVDKDAEKQTRDVEDNSSCPVDDETAAIDRILADIDKNLRESHEFNEKYMKTKNATKEDASEVSEAHEDTTQEIISNQTTTDNLVHNVILGASEEVIAEKSPLADTYSDANEDARKNLVNEASFEPVEVDIIAENITCKQYQFAYEDQTEDMPSNENSAEDLLEKLDTIETADSLKPPRVAEEENASSDLDDAQEDLEPQASELTESENITESLNNISEPAQTNDEEEAIQSEIVAVNQNEFNEQTEFLLNEISENDLNEILLNVRDELSRDTAINEAVSVEEQIKDDNKALNDLIQNAKTITTVIEEQVNEKNCGEESKSFNLNERNAVFFEDKAEETTQSDGTKIETNAEEKEKLMCLEGEARSEEVNDVNNDQSVEEKALSTNTTVTESADELLPTEIKTTRVNESEIVEVNKFSTENHVDTLSNEDDLSKMVTLKTNQVEQANEVSITEENEPNEDVTLTEMKTGEAQTHANLETPLPEKYLEIASELIKSRALEVNNISGDEYSTTTDKEESTPEHESSESIVVNDTCEIVDETVSKDVEEVEETECIEELNTNITNREEESKENIHNEEESSAIETAAEAINKITQDSVNEFEKCALTADETISTEETVPEEAPIEYIEIESVNEMSNENSTVIEKQHDSVKCVSVEETVYEVDKEIEETICIEELDLDIISEEHLQDTDGNEEHILSNEISTIETAKETAHDSVNKFDKCTLAADEKSEAISIEKIVAESEKSNEITVQMEDFCTDSTKTVESSFESHEVDEPSATKQTEYESSEKQEEEKLSQPTEIVQPTTEPDIDETTPLEAAYHDITLNETHNTVSNTIEQSHNELEFESTSISDKKLLESGDIFIEKATEVPDIEPLLIVTSASSNVDTSADNTVGVEEASRQSIDDTQTENVAETKQIKDGTNADKENPLPSYENLNVMRVDVSPTDGNTDKTGDNLVSPNETVVCNRTLEEVIVDTKDLQKFHESHTAEILETVEDVPAEITKEVTDEENSLTTIDLKKELEENKQAEISKSHTTVEANESCGNSAEIVAKTSEELNSNAITVAKEESLKIAEQNVEAENDDTVEDAVVKSTNNGESNEKDIDGDPLVVAETALDESEAKSVEMSETSSKVLETEENEQKISNENVEIFNEKLAEATELTESPSGVCQNSVSTSSAAEAKATNYLCGDEKVAPSEDVQLIETIEETSTEPALASHIETPIVEETKKDVSANEEEEVVLPNENVEEIELESITEKVDKTSERNLTEDGCPTKVDSMELSPIEIVANKIHDDKSERMEETGNERSFEREQTEGSMYTAEKIVEDTQTIEATPIDPALSKDTVAEQTALDKRVEATKKTTAVMEEIKESIAEKSDAIVPECENKNSATSDNTELNAFAANTPDSKRSDKEIVDTSFSKQKSKQKAKSHKLMKSSSTQKRGSPLSCVHKKVIKSKSLRLLGLKRTKSRLASGSELNQNWLMDREETGESELTEELVNNIARLVIEESTEVETESEGVPGDTTFTEPTQADGDATEQIRQQESLPRADNKELAVSVEAVAEVSTEQQTTQTEAATANDCSTLQRLPADYNSEEILAVATLINMRNKYNFIDDEALVAEVSQDINRQPAEEIVNEDAAAGSEEAEAKIAPVKKRVSFDEENLLQLCKEKRNIVKKVKKLAKKKLGKSHKTAGSLLSSGGSSGKKYVQQRLLELMNASDETDETATTESEPEPPMPDVPKKRRCRKLDAATQEAQLLLTEVPAPGEETKIDNVQNDNKVYPVRLTSRHKTEAIIEMKPTKSNKNVGLRRVQRDLSPKTANIETLVSDFIVPDEKVQPLCAENCLKPKSSRDNVVNISRVSVDGTKIKFKITQKDGLGKEKSATSSQNEEQLKEIEIKKEIFSPKKVMKTRRLVVKIKRLKLSAFPIVNSKASVVSAASATEQIAPTNSCEDLPKTCPAKLETNLPATSMEKPSPALVDSSALFPHNAETEVVTVAKDAANISTKAAKKTTRGKSSNVVKTTSKDLEATLKAKTSKTDPSKAEVLTATKLTPIREVATLPAPLSNSEKKDVNFVVTEETTLNNALPAQTTDLDNNAEVAATHNDLTAKSPTKNLIKEASSSTKKSVENKLITTTSPSKEASSSTKKSAENKMITTTSPSEEASSSTKKSVENKMITTTSPSKEASSSTKKSAENKMIPLTSPGKKASSAIEKSVENEMITTTSPSKEASSATKKSMENKMITTTSPSKEASSTEASPKKEHSIIKAGTLQKQPQTEQQPAKVDDSKVEACPRVPLSKKDNSKKKTSHRRRLEFTEDATTSKEEFTKQSTLLKNLDLMINEESASFNITPKGTQKKSPLKTADKTETAAVSSASKDITTVKTVANKESSSTKDNKIRERSPLKKPRVTVVESTIKETATQKKVTITEETTACKAMAKDEAIVGKDHFVMKIPAKTEQTQESTLLENLELKKTKEPTTAKITVKDTTEKKRQLKATNEDKAVALFSVRKDFAVAQTPTEEMLSTTQNATIEEVTDELETSKLIDKKLAKALASEKHTARAEASTAEVTANTELVRQSTLLENLDLMKIVDTSSNTTKKDAEKKRNKKTSIEKTTCVSEDISLAQTSPNEDLQSASSNKAAEAAPSNKALEAAPSTKATEAVLTETSSVKTQSTVKDDRRGNKSTKKPLTVDLPHFENIDIKKIKVLASPAQWKRQTKVANEIKSSTSAATEEVDKTSVEDVQPNMGKDSVEKASNHKELLTLADTTTAKKSSNKESASVKKSSKLEKNKHAKDIEKEKAQNTVTSTEVAKSTHTTEESKITSDTNLADTKIKTEPLEGIEKTDYSTEDIQIKEEEISQDAVDVAETYLNVDAKRCRKEIVIKPFDVILTEEKINQQAEAHRGCRNKERLRKCQPKVVDKILPVAGTTSARTRRTKVSSRSENVETAGDQMIEIGTTNVLKKVPETPKVVETSTDKAHPELVGNAEREATVGKTVPVPSAKSASTRRTKMSSKRGNVKTAGEQLSEIDTTNALEKVPETPKVVEASTDKANSALAANTEREASVDKTVPVPSTTSASTRKAKASSKRRNVETSSEQFNEIDMTNVLKKVQETTKVVEASTDKVHIEPVENVEKQASEDKTVPVVSITSARTRRTKASSKRRRAETSGEQLSEIDTTNVLNKVPETPKVVEAPSNKDINTDKDHPELVENAKKEVTVEQEVECVAELTKSTATTRAETEEIANQITEIVIAELKLLSPEGFQDLESEKEQENTASSSPNAACGGAADFEKDTNLAASAAPVAADSCAVTKCDEDQKTALLLDSSIDIVLGNSSFTKINLNSAEEIATAMEGDSGNVTNTTQQSKSRLDVLTAERINSVFEKLLKEQCSPNKDSAKSAVKESHAQLKRQATTNEDEGPRKASNRSSLSSVKQISAKVPEALFADDESESSNADDSTNGEQFFAPILSLDDLLIKKDEPAADVDVAHNFPSKEETNTLSTVEAGHSHDGLGTPNFAVELEVETTQSSVGNTQAEQQAEGTNEKLEETVKCVGGEELNTNLEETDANFSLSMTDISAIDIPGDLNINSEYPDLLDAMLFEQVRQSIDCMISGTNSAKKWSQDSFATTQPAVVNFNPTEPVATTEDQHQIAPLPQENISIPTIDGKPATNNDDAIGIGQESFLGTITSLDEVEVPTTGFDLVGSFTIAEFLSEAGTDLFAFPELDKTQSRNNSISSESNTCDTPPLPAVDNVDEETSSDRPYESATMQSQQSQNTNSVACDHSYNKDINEVEKSKTKVRKKSTSSNTSTPRQKIVPSPLKSPDLLNVFSRAKCHPKPFWKVKRMDELKTSTPKKEEQSPNLLAAQQVPAAVKRAINLSPTDVEKSQSDKKQRTGFSMPALELGIEPNLLDVNISRELPENITLTNNSEKNAKNAGESTLKSTETPGTSKDTARNDNANLSNKPETINSATMVRNRSSTPVEITEVITIPAPVLIQPIIRIQSQTNRLERIDPTLSTSQQVFTLVTAESQANFTEPPLNSSIKVDKNSRSVRDSTPTLDEHDKNDYGLSSPNKKLTINVSPGKAEKEKSAMEIDEPPAKRLCVENVSEVMPTNELFDTLKVEEKSQKADKPTCAADNSPTMDLEVDSSESIKNKQPSISSNKIDSSPTKEIKTDDVRVSVETENNTLNSKQNENEKQTSASLTASPLNKSPTAETPATKETQEPILISKETLAALRIREQALENSMKPTELFEPLTADSTLEESPPKSTPSTIKDDSRKNSPKVCIEASREKKSTPLDTTPDLYTSKNRPVAAQPKRRISVETKRALLPSVELPTNIRIVSPVTPSSAERASSTQLKKQKDNPVISVSLPKETPFKSNTNTNLSKTNNDSNTNRGISQEKDATSKSNHIKTKDLPTAEALRSELKNTSPYQQAPTISSHSRVPPKPAHAAVPSALHTNSNRYHPYQKKSTPPPLSTSSSSSSSNPISTHKSRFEPRRQSRDSQSSTSTTSSEKFLQKRKDILKPTDKSCLQRLPSGITTLPPSMHSRPPLNSQPSISSTAQPPSAIELAAIKLTPQEENEIKRKLEEYRTTLPTAKTYGAHKENQRLVNVQEEILRRYYAERAHRRKQAQQQRGGGSGSGGGGVDTQRSKRKANTESYESNYKKVSMHTHKSNVTTTSGGSRNSVGAPAAASCYQHKSKPQQHHTTNRSSRPHQEYVNKFGEIEKLVEKEKKGSTASAVPLTASTAWEPKMPTGDELLELLSKTKKS